MSPGLSRKDRLRLGDIKVASETIADHLALLDAGKTPESVLLDAIKYNLVAIGEAANHTSEGPPRRA